MQLFCFTKGCPHLAGPDTNNGVTTSFDVRFVNWNGVPDKALITLDFCSPDCLSQLATKAIANSGYGKKVTTGQFILGQVLATHRFWLQRRKTHQCDVPELSRKAPTIDLPVHADCPFAIRYAVPTAGETGQSQALIKLTFGSLQTWQAFKEECPSVMELLLFLEARAAIL